MVNGPGYPLHCLVSHYLLCLAEEAEEAEEAVLRSDSERDLHSSLLKFSADRQTDSEAVDLSFSFPF